MTKGRDIPKLRDRDIKILELAASGLEYEEIATQVNFRNAQSVRNRVAKIAIHLGADNLRHAIAIAMRKQIIK